MTCVVVAHTAASVETVSGATKEAFVGPGAKNEAVSGHS